MARSFLGVFALLGLTRCGAVVDTSAVRFVDEAGTGSDGGYADAVASDDGGTGDVTTADRSDGSLNDGASVDADVGVLECGEAKVVTHDVELGYAHPEAEAELVGVTEV